MKVVVDMNLSPNWVSFLARAKHDVVHWSDIGSDKATDHELMAWALENGHVVRTADLDFGAILAATEGTGPSVIQIRSDLLTPQAIGKAVIQVLQQAKAELIEGALISVDAKRARLRILPLR